MSNKSVYPPLIFVLIFLLFTTRFYFSLIYLLSKTCFFPLISLLSTTCFYFVLIYLLFMTFFCFDLFTVHNPFIFPLIFYSKTPQAGLLYLAHLGESMLRVVIRQNLYKIRSNIFLIVHILNYRVISSQSLSTNISNQNVFRQSIGVKELNSEVLRTEWLLRVSKSTVKFYIDLPYLGDT